MVCIGVLFGVGDTGEEWEFEGWESGWAGKQKVTS